MAKKSKPTTEHTLDVFVGPLRGKGDQSVAILVRDHVGPENPSTKQVQAAIDFFKEDARFILTDKGLESTVRLVEQPDGFEPEEITLGDEQAQATQQERRQDPSAGEPFASPAPTGEAAPVPTIGEQLAKQDEERHQVEAVETIDLEPTAEEAQRRDDRVRAFEEKEAKLKELKAGIDALDNKIEHLKEDLKGTKARKKEIEAERDALIDGDLQPSIPTDRPRDTDPADTPIGKAISGQAPMLSEAPVEGMIRKMGAEMAIQGKTELDCPFSREKDARAVAMWLDGFREAKREDHGTRVALVQGLTRDMLVAALLPHHGILPPGEAAPKLIAVEWDKRPHLVLDMLAESEGPVVGEERWALLPLFKRDEWSSGEGCPAMTYGDGVEGSHTNPEKEETRKKGGVDCARFVKVGRSKFIAGPLQLMSVAIVKTEQQSAAAS